MKKFTLIELIVVIAILSILSSIIIPNIKNFKETAIETALVSNTKSVQTAVDYYSVRNRNQFPSKEQPSFEKPSEIDFKKLIPKSLRSIPKQGYYWIDFSGTVWASTIDAPTGYIKDESTKTISWTKPVGNVNSYKVYGTNISSGKSNKVITLLGETKLTSFDYSSYNYNTYMVSSIDNKGFESALIATPDYVGINPVSNLGIGSNIPDVPDNSLVTNVSVRSVLSLPEEGWQRFDDRDSNLKYGGTWTNNTSSYFYKNTWKYAKSTLDKNNFVEIKFVGTGIRIIGRDYTHGYETIEISIDGQIETFTQLSDDGAIRYKVLQFSKTGLSNKEHIVRINGTVVGTQTNYLMLDAFDIDANGTLLNAN